MHEAAAAGANAGGYDRDGAAVRQHEMIGGGLCHLPRSDQIVADDGLKALVVELARRRHELTPGVVDENIEFAELALDALHRRFDPVRLADVGRHRKSNAAGLPGRFFALPATR